MGREKGRKRGEEGKRMSGRRVRENSPKDT